MRWWNQVPNLDIKSRCWSSNSHQFPLVYENRLNRSRKIHLKIHIFISPDIFLEAEKMKPTISIICLTLVAISMADDVNGSRVKRQYGALRPSLGGSGNYNPYAGGTGGRPGYNNQGGYNQGGYQGGQGGYNQGGYQGGQGGYNQGGYQGGQGGYNQGGQGYNQGGYNQGYNQGGGYGFGGGGYGTGIGGGLDYNQPGGNGYGR